MWEKGRCGATSEEEEKEEEEEKGREGRGEELGAAADTFLLRESNSAGRERREQVEGGSLLSGANREVSECM